MPTFYYVYILQSLHTENRFYVGYTEDLEERIVRHNRGIVPATASARPWRYKTCIAYTCRDQALAMEKYLKTHSGRAFASKRR